MSAPFPSDLVASREGRRVAWVFNDQGRRNIWVASAPDYQGRPLTHYTSDDGQEISHLKWTPDGEAILYVRGGRANRRGEFPNPTFIVTGVEQEVWLAPLDGTDPRRIAAGAAPAVSPAGDRVVFVAHNQVWSAPLDGSSEPAQLLHTRGRASSLVFSPRGTRLAFVSRRGDHAFVGIYDFSSRRLVYLEPGVDRDFSPAWSPDGRRVAFIRVPARTRKVVFGARRRGTPWSIWVADAASGQGHLIWRAPAGRGSVFRFIPAASQLMWAEGDVLVFPWERDGWTHLYAVSASGAKARLLTPGSFEVEHTALSPDRTHVVYASNQGDIDRRHLWRVAVRGGAPQALTRGRGIEWAPAPAGDGSLVFLLHSGARRPARPAALRMGGTVRDLAKDAIPADFPSASLVEPQPVILPAADGLKLHGQLFRPGDIRAGERRPAIVFFHGGSRRQMLLGWHYMYYYHNAYALNQYLASRGFIVLSLNYRSGIGYGMEFREALHYGASGGSEYNDVQGAGLYLAGRPDVDPKRIGLWGGSYGGYLTALGLARASDLFAAGVDLHGVHDWNLEFERLLPGWDLLKEQKARQVAWRSSPMAYVKQWRSPVLLIQGDDDRNVTFSQTVQLAEDLRRQGVAVQLLVFPDEVHDFLTHAHWLEAYRRAADFFQRRLGDSRGR